MERPTVTRVGTVALATLLAVAVPQGRAQAADAPPAAGLSLDLRLRSEQVDDQAFVDPAQATTLRARVGWRMPISTHWNALVEIEHTSHLGGERYNSTANGRTGYPTIADPDNTELEQAWLAWTPNPATRVALGRQRLNYDNQRFIGAVGWRQNDQSFDALDLTHRSAHGWQWRYSYLDRVQRVFGSDNPNPLLAHWQLDAHLFSVAHALGPGTLTGYAYLLDNQSLPLSSHRNLGLRYALRQADTKPWRWFLNVELTQQHRYAGGSALINAHYALLEGGALWRGSTFKAGRELLSGDGQYGFQTPLATLHAFNGWADKFTTTPVAGLEDRYLGWNRHFGKFEATVAWHDYRSDRGGLDLGSEWDASLGWAPAAHWLVLAKAANYHAGPLGKDLRKTWVSVEYSH
ncbi:MAG: alginate export family protein [Arenimonas sp.]